ncbi:hypothetical protein [Nocardioides sp. IC4_145]|uniref:hypothetical protein n=1 Tax=Nocardioides sp. IC4_145 TaxID=2714037 RepID=UPI001F604D16|nr:hypothetical protein [Nocardioides sp. IC4_145]
MTIEAEGRDPVVTPITRFHTEFSVPVSGRGGDGRPQVGAMEMSDLWVYLPHSARATEAFNIVAGRAPLAEVSVDMCRADRLTTDGENCALNVNVEMRDVVLRSVETSETVESSLEATALRFDPHNAVITYTRRFERGPGGQGGRPDVIRYEQGEPSDVTLASSEEVVPGSGMQAVFGERVFTLDDWALGVDNSGRSSGGGIGSPAHSSMRMTMHGPRSAVHAIGRMARGGFLSVVEVTGCRVGPCTQSFLLEEAFFERVTLGSPTLTTAATLNFGKIRWNRVDASGTSDHSWDVVGGSGLR